MNYSGALCNFDIPGAHMNYIDVAGVPQQLWRKLGKDEGRRWHDSAFGGVGAWGMGVPSR
jgi:hypothetical protein